jgi:hypothetical protein
VAVEVRRAGLQRVRDRFQLLYSNILNGTALQAVADEAKKVSIVQSPLEAYANYSVGIVLIGAAAGRGASISSTTTNTPKDYFCVDPFDGALWKWLMIVHSGGLQIDAHLASRLYQNVELKHEGKVDDGTGDWALPIKLGLLHQLRGYRPNMMEAMESYHQSVREVVQVLAIMLLVNSDRSFRRLGAAPIDPSGGEASPGEIEQTSSQLQLEELTHFLDHAIRYIDDVQDRYAFELINGGFAMPRKQEAGSRPRDADSIVSSLRKIPLDQWNRIRRNTAQVFCSSDRNDIRAILRNLELNDSGQSPRTKRKRRTP